MADDLQLAPEVFSAAQLRARRVRLGLSQVDLGRVLNVSANTIARWERGERVMRQPEMVLLALEHLESRKTLDWREAERSTSLAQIPATPGRLVDRRDETAALIALLRGGSRRLITLTGVGGSGKTRLALEV